MSSELSIIELVLHASGVVQLVLAILVLASILSWTLIFDRARVLKRARRAADEFEQRFWTSSDLSQLYKLDIIPVCPPNKYILSKRCL